MWFRRDLRLDDNQALFKALSESAEVMPVFIFDPNILNKLNNKNHPGVYFLHASLKALKEKLQREGSDLLTLFGDPAEEYKKLKKTYDFDAIYFNEDYEPQAIKRDTNVKNLCASMGVNFLGFKDHVVFSQNEVLKEDNTPYTVYTPYKKKWLFTLLAKPMKASPSEKHLLKLKKTKPFALQSLEDLGFSSPNIELPKRAIDKKILTRYAQRRNFPFEASTTRLGPHLRFGTVSIRKCVDIALKTSDVWLSELIWRDFFIQILAHFPRVVNESFRPQYDKIKWRNNEAEFKLWCEGKTGYPIVDAGMRELTTTGFMHNRVRMVVASFLTKHLLIDWRWGEAFFKEYLLDYELAANNGNWQWAAGTGCDAAPYFRVFNPEEQQKKFDPEFKYIKTWVPEYGTKDYPEPIVEHKLARLRALRTYKSAL
jgi:deoxyribodipyrimidine photo-lyase